MAYCKKWIPPTIPLRDNLTAWKTLFTDLHDNMIAAGLVQTDTVGQLDFDDVTALPADGSFAGFREYAFDDALQATAPVLIKIEFGCGMEGLLVSSSTTNRRTRTPRVRTVISFSGQESISFQCPQALNTSGGNTSQPISEGISYISHQPSKGFFGFVYGAGSRNKPFAGTQGGYYGATFSCFIQRTTDEYGNPTPNGLMIYAPNLTENAANNLWTSGNLQGAYSQYIDGDEAVGASQATAMRLGGNANSVHDGEILVQQVFCMSKKDRIAFPWIVSYAAEHGAHSIPEGTEFMLEVYPGTESRFVALGNETSISTDYPSYQRSGIAMLFEDD